MKGQSSVLKTDEGESPPRVRIPVPPSGIVNLTYGELVNKTTGNNMRTILIALLMALMNKVGKL